jgi:hypothetical protein
LEENLETIIRGYGRIDTKGENNKALKKRKKQQQKTEQRPAGHY